LDDGELRVHVPVVTNLDVAFFLAGEQVIMQEGEAWYLNLNLPHRVENHSDIDRIHLVIDCVVDDWVRELFPPKMVQAPTHARI
jgi:aspartyl/asparaginyl beta-hydroxylase (cupin superfamily)